MGFWGYVGATIVGGLIAGVVVAGVTLVVAGVLPSLGNPGPSKD